MALGLLISAGVKCLDDDRLDEHLTWWSALLSSAPIEVEVQTVRVQKYLCRAGTKALQ